MLGKWYKDLQGFKWAEVTEAEEKEVQAILRKKNIEIMRECITDGIVISNELREPEHQIDNIDMAIATALFEKRATQFFTIEQAFLDDKIQMLKQKDNPRPMTQGEIKTLGGEEAAKTIEEAGKP